MRHFSTRLGNAMWRTAMAVAVVACVGCGAATTDAPGGQSIAGTWRSTDADSGFVVTLTLSESGSVVSGSGSTNENPPGVITVSGTYQSSDVELTLKVVPQGTVDQNGATLSFSGTTTSSSTMAGTISGGGQADHNATFTRQ